MKRPDGAPTTLRRPLIAVAVVALPLALLLWTGAAEHRHIAAVKLELTEVAVVPRADSHAPNDNS